MSTAKSSSVEDEEGAVDRDKQRSYHRNGHRSPAVSSSLSSGPSGRRSLTLFHTARQWMSAGHIRMSYAALLVLCLACSSVAVLLSHLLLHQSQSSLQCSKVGGAQVDDLRDSTSSNSPLRTSALIAATPIPPHPSFASHFQLGPSPPAEPAFSTHRCVGPDVLYSSRSDDYVGRRCILHNVCLSTDVAYGNASEEVSVVVDYLRPEREAPDGWVEPFSPFTVRSTPRPLVALRHGGRAERIEKLHSLVVSVRQTWNSGRSRRFVPGVHVLHQLLAVGDMNFGHFLLDDAYAMWETVRSFKPNPALNNADGVQLLLVHGCANYSAPLDRMCAKFAAALFPVVSNRPVLDVQSAYSHYHVDERSEQLCFETLIAGTGSAGAVGWGPNNRNRAASFAAFRNEMYLAHGLDPFHRPQRHHLVLVDKRGRRGFSNLRAMYEQLKLTPRYAEVEMSVVADFAQRSFVDQLRLLSSATIVLSPCGGISMLFLLLPSPATLIVSTYPELRNGSVQSVRMEGHVWDWQSNVHAVHYPLLDQSDYVLPDNIKPSSRYALRNHASTVLKVGRLRHIIDQAILRASSLN